MLARSVCFLWAFAVPVVVSSASTTSCLLGGNTRTRPDAHTPDRELQTCPFTCTPKVHFATIAQANGPGGSEVSYYNTLSDTSICKRDDATLIQLAGVSACTSQISSVTFTLLPTEMSWLQIKGVKDYSAPYTAFGDDPVTTGKVLGAGNYTLKVVIKSSSGCILHESVSTFTVKPCAADVAFCSALSVNPTNRHRYGFFPTRMSWYAAQAAARNGPKCCGGRAGHLVSISDAGEDAFVSALSTSESWIGLTDAAAEGVMRWEDGTPLTYTHYEDVDGYNGGPFDCAYAWNDNNEWLMEECDNPYFFNGYTVEYDCA